MSVCFLCMKVKVREGLRHGELLLKNKARRDGFKVQGEEEVHEAAGEGKANILSCSQFVLKVS